MSIYLDNAATTELLPVVKEKIVQSLDKYENPSSFYKPASDLEKEINYVRKLIAQSLGYDESEVYFTSGATESSNTIIQGIVESKRGDFNIVTSTIEHPSIMEIFKYYKNKGIDVRFIDVDEFGHLNLESLSKALDKKTALISIMGVNNELGTILDLKEVMRLKEEKAPQAVFHTDYVQAFTKSTDSRIDLKAIHPDAVSLTAHKIHGPKGIGAMIINKEIYIPSLVYGGGQEKGLRSGTENTLGILAFGEAVKDQVAKIKQNESYLKELKEYLLDQLKEIKGIHINSPEDGVPNIISISIDDIKSEVLLHILETKGIYISSGSACSTHHKGNAVLDALGYSKSRKEGTIRISLSEFNTKEDIDKLVEEIQSGIQQLQILKRFKK